MRASHARTAFLVRRAICGIESTGLHAVFKKLWKAAGGDPAKVRASIVSKTVVFPDDETFEAAIRTGDLYHRKVCAHMIEEYERRYTTGDVLSTFPPITVDHVMPQTLKGAWTGVFTPQEHAQLLHTWGNLVPLSSEANSTKGTSSWHTARERLGNETVFSTTKHVFDAYPEWTRESIESRTEDIVEWALERWPYHSELLTAEDVNEPQDA